MTYYHFTKQGIMLRVKRIMRSIAKIEDKVLIDCDVAESQRASFIIFDKAYASAIINIGTWGIAKCKPYDKVPDTYAAKLITDCFHEAQHVRQKINIRDGVLHGRFDKEMACDDFISMAYASYRQDIDTLELDAEIAGLVGTMKYCEAKLPKFDYEKAVVESVNTFGHKYLSENGYDPKDIRNFDDLINTLGIIRETIYDKPVTRRDDVANDKKTRLDFAISDSFDVEYKSGTRQKADLISFAAANTDDARLLNSIVVRESLHTSLLDEYEARENLRKANADIEGDDLDDGETERMEYKI